MYSLKPIQKLQARKLGVIIQPSTKGFSKIDVFDKDNNYLTSIGDRRYKDFATYVETDGYDHASKRRDLYWKRHKRDNVPGTKGFYALQILW